jgi:peptide chain release factor subunit 1
MSASAATPTGTISSSEISITERIRRKRFLTNLATNSGSNTSMVTVAIGPGSQITLMVRKLEEKRAAASNIKDRVNRQAVEDAYTSAIIKLQTLTQSDIGPTGLYLFSGMRENEKGIMKRVCELYKPLKTVSDFFYCDKNFQVDALLRELNNDPVFGFVIVDGAGTLYGTV